jgi:hypothetical protein
MYEDLHSLIVFKVFIRFIDFILTIFQDVLALLVLCFLVMRVIWSISFHLPRVINERQLNFSTLVISRFTQESFHGAFKSAAHHVARFCRLSLNRNWG